MSFAPHKVALSGRMSRMPYGPVVHLALLFAAMLPAHSANAQYLIPKPLDPPTSTIIVSILSPQSLPSNSSSSLSTPMPTVPVVGILNSPLSGIPNPSPSSLIPTPSSPIQTPFLSSAELGPSSSSGGVIGGVVGVCFLAVCLGLVVFWYIERWRRCVLVLFANRFRGNRAGSAPRNSNYHADSFFSDQGRERGRSVAEIHEHAHAQVNAGSLVARAPESSMDSGSLDRLANLSHHAYREGNDGNILSEKLLRELRSSNSTHHHHNRVPATWGGPTRRRTEEMVSEMDAVVEETAPPDHVEDTFRSPRYEMDGGVRLAGGRVGEVAMQNFDQQSVAVSDGSTLPPPYSSDFGDV